jgi:RHS repeat-associated protein
MSDPSGAIAVPDTPTRTGPLAIASGDGLPSGNGSRSYELWIKTDVSAAQQALFTTGDRGTRQAFNLILDNPTTLRIYVNGDDHSFTLSKAINDNTWHSIAIVYDGPSLTLSAYVDGLQVGASQGLTAGLQTPVPGRGMYIGSDDDGTGAVPFYGSIDEIAVYGSSLSATQVANQARAGHPLGGVLDVASSRAGGRNESMAACAYCSKLHGNATASPVDTASGNFWHQFNDISIPGRGFPLAFSHTYNSSAAGTDSGLGYGWSDNLGASLSVNRSNVTITQESGSQVTFTQSGNSYVAPPRVTSTLVHNGDGTYTLTRQAVDVLAFSSTGQLTSRKNLNGYSLVFGYTNGQLTSIVDPAGRQLAVSWSGSHIASVSDVNVTPNRQVSFTYDASSNLTDVMDVAGGNYHFTYDANHRLLTMRDQRGNTVTNHYDSSGRVDWQTDQLNRKTTFGFASDGSTTTTTDPKGNVTVETYKYGLRTAVTKGSGTSSAATWTYAYDPATLAITQVTDPNNHSTVSTFDASANPLTVRDALGHQTTSTYNALNEPLTVQDPNGVTTTNTYDSSGNLLTTSTPLVGSNPAQSRTTTLQYNDSTHLGDVTGMVDPNSKTWSYVYDAYGDRTSVTDPLGNKSTVQYNADGWKTSSVTPKGNVSGCNCAAQYTTSYAHNAFGQVTTTTDPLGHQSINHYDAAGNRDWSKDGNGRQTSYTYDAANELTTTTRPDLSTLVTDYNADGTVLDQKDGKNNATTYGYDPLGRTTSVSDPLGRATTSTYDGAGNLLTVTDAQTTAQTKTMTYDPANRLSSISYSDGHTPNVTSIQYDADNQRTSMTDGTGTSTWSRDSLHRLTQSKNGAGSTIGYGYDLKGQLTSLVYPGSTGTITRAYDDAGRWTSVQDWLGNTTGFGYDANSNLITETLPSASGIVDSFSYDAADRLLNSSAGQPTITVTKAGNTIASFSYTRDAADQLTSTSSTLPNQTLQPENDSYTQNSQLCFAGPTSSPTCASSPSGSQYAYDAADNPTTLRGASQAFDAANQLCWTSATTSSNACANPPSGATVYGYDRRGNRTSVTPSGQSTISLTYDQENRLTGYGSATYTYDGDGLRMSKNAGTSEAFSWDVSGGLPLMIVDGSQSFVYGPGGLPLEQVSGTAATWLHHDQIGSTRLLTDASGSVLATYTFDPYGNLTGSTGSSTTAIRFAGQYWDSESAMYYLRARYYEPSTGQFQQRDPVGSKTREPYAYTAGSPLNGVDPSGLCGTILWSLSPALCMTESASPGLAGSPVAAPLAAAATMGGDVVTGVNDHATFGYAGCWIGCMNVEQQGGVVSLQTGGVGLINRGPYVGWANKSVDARANTTATAAACWGLGLALSQGYPDGNLPSDPSDWEVDTAIGLGGQYGPMRTIFAIDARPALNWIGQF